MYGIGRNELDVVSFAVRAFGKNIVGQSLSALPDEQRAQLYRQFSANAIQRAQAAPSEVMRAGHLSMAAGWHSLAIEVELSMGRFDKVAEEFDSFPGYALRRGG